MNQTQSVLNFLTLLNLSDKFLLFFFFSPGLVLNFPTIPGISRQHLSILAFSQFPVTRMGVSLSWVDSDL